MNRVAETYPSRTRRSSRRIASVGLGFLLASVYASLIVISSAQSLDMQSQLSVIDYYTDGEGALESIFDLVKDNNSMVVLYKILPFLPPDYLVKTSYGVIAFLWALFLLRQLPITTALIFLISTFVVCLNTNRQLLALIIAYYAISSPLVTKSLATIAAFSVHNTAVVPYLIKHITLPKTLLAVSIIAYVALNFDLTFLKYGYSTNSSTIQRNLLPSILILFVVSFAVDGYRGVYKGILLFLLFSVIFYVLVAKLNFNQFIYTSRVAWVALIALVVLRSQKFFSIRSGHYFLANISLLIFGAYHNYVLVRDWV